MYYLPTSCLVFFFLFFFFSNHLSCASTKKELGWCEAKFECGNITAGFPFSGGSRPQFCGHPSLELHCYENKTAIIISNHLYDVLHLDQTSKTLRLVRAELNVASFCNASFTTATLPPEVFELSPTSQSLIVFYLCDRNHLYSSSYTCPGRGPVSVSQNLDYHKSCQDSFRINVPRSYLPEEKELNLTHLKNALSEGFDVKVKIDEQICEECVSSHGTCGFKNTTQICCKNDSTSRCNPLHIPHTNELHRLCSQPFSCGNQSGLFYPFWTSEREACGHPDFKLDDCNGGFAEFSISSVKFRILEVNYEYSFIRLARSDYIGGDLCPKDPLNVPFDESVLPLVPNTTLLTIYYGCRQDLSRYESTYVGALSCDDDDGRGYYYVNRNLSPPLPQGISSVLSNFSVFCDRNVTTPASRPALNALQSSSSRDNLKKALEESFDLGLNPDCSRCLASKGACGYDQSSHSFTCYRYIEPNNRTTIDPSLSPISPTHRPNRGVSPGAIAGIGIALGLLGIILLAGSCFCFIIQRRKISDNPRYKNLKALIQLKHYSYAQLKRITNSFAEVVGKGGFGTVYRGTLCDGRHVAVKILKDSKSDGEDFVNEVASMSKTSHVNIVDLLGFCSEGSKRAIIYEFLGNGSLDKFISNKTSVDMDWTTLYQIALGVARGVEYLHHGCKTRIVHFDIKPQNVLLDENFCPKVSDFGLAKLCERKESILSMLDTRGTIGYIAPELFSRMYGRVSHKSDVYSYGMLVLEMIGARNKERADQNSASNASSMYFPEWIYKDLEKGHVGTPKGNGISNEEEEIVKKMTLVGLWCIQPSSSDRPLMNRVVEMMEGSVDALEVPPRPVFQIPAAPFQEPSTLSEDILSYKEVCSMDGA